MCVCVFLFSSMYGLELHFSILCCCSTARCLRFSFYYHFSLTAGWLNAALFYWRRLNGQRNLAQPHDTHCGGLSQHMFFLWSDALWDTFKRNGVVWGGTRFSSTKSLGDHLHSCLRETEECKIKSNKYFETTITICATTKKL